MRLSLCYNSSANKVQFKLFYIDLSQLIDNQSTKNAKKG